MSDERPKADENSEEPTRREWLLRLGGLTALAGVAGLTPDIAGVSNAAQEPVAAGLPPGLYEPSGEHLSHVLSARGAPVVPRGTETDYAPARTGLFQPRFFTGAELRAVTRLVGMLLGSVDARALSETVEWMDLRLHSDPGVRQAARSLSPLHRAVAVAYHGEAKVAELETLNSQTLVRSGLQQLDHRSRTRFGREFLQLDEPAQTDLLSETSRAATESPLRRLYEWLRREAIRGYFTSQAGLQELDYKGNAFHGACPGCDRRPPGT